MKTPTNMLKSITADIVESTSLLEVVYRNNELPPEVDNALACLIRSMQKTSEIAYEYIDEQLSHTNIEEIKSNNVDICDDVSAVVTTAKKLKELSHMYTEFYFTNRDNDNPRCYMADAIHDYAHNLCAQLEFIESKLN